MDRDRGFRGGGFRSFSPVRVGEELDVKIEAVGEKGDGIAKKNGFVLFVPGTKEGQEVRIRVTKVLRKVGFAEVIGKSEGTSGEGSPKEGTEEQREEQQEESYKDTENFGEEAPKPSEEETEYAEESEDLPQDSE